MAEHLHFGKAAAELKMT
ncbi:hypothetical protein [Corynebacterium deserti]